MQGKSLSKLRYGNLQTIKLDRLDFLFSMLLLSTFTYLILLDCQDST